MAVCQEQRKKLRERKSESERERERGQWEGGRGNGQQKQLEASLHSIDKFNGCHSELQVIINRRNALQTELYSFGIHFAPWLEIDVARITSQGALATHSHTHTPTVGN